MAFNQSMRSSERNAITDLGPTPRVGVLGRTLALLESFGTGDASLSLAELSRRAGLPKPTVHRMLAEMCSERMLERLDDGSYRLGLRLFEIGERVQSHRSLSEAALPIMEDLRQVTKQRIHLAVLDGVEVVYVEILGVNLVNVGSRTGGRFPAHATGVGKAMLAYSPAAVVKARVEAGLPRLTPRTIATPGALQRDLQHIRTKGFAEDREESHLGISCVAAPVFGSDGKVRAALSVTGRTKAINPISLGPAVRTTANTLSRELRQSGL